VVFWLRTESVGLSLVEKAVFNTDAVILLSSYYNIDCILFDWDLGSEEPAEDELPPPLLLLPVL